MKLPHTLVDLRIWFVVLLLLLAAHLGGAFLIRHRVAAISATLGVAAVVAIAHLGLLSPIVALLCRRTGR